MAVKADPRAARAVGPASTVQRREARRGVVFAPAGSAPEGAAALGKRVLDVALASALLVGLAPLFLLTAALVRLDSPGPVLLGQDRIGRGLRTFRMYKFRSMVADADQLRENLQHLNEVDGPIFKIRNDPRVTRMGAFLRRSSLDELPQLWNVLRGEMSLVGPRPPFAHEVEHDLLRQRARLRFPPGMTGLWQVGGRSNLTYQAMVRLDLRYVRDWSLFADLGILLRTIPVVLTGKGAC
jgi:lipopolysaccharide/colanic/teichoic acid biosynthesis glycosyltransferase